MNLKFKKLITIFLVISAFIYILFDLSASADLWFRVSGGVSVVSLKINDKEVFDVGETVEEDQFIFINPSYGSNKIDILCVQPGFNDPGSVSCTFQRTAHRCDMTVYLSNKNFVCTDCNHIR